LWREFPRRRWSSGQVSVWLHPIDCEFLIKSLRELCLSKEDLDTFILEHVSATQRAFQIVKCASATCRYHGPPSSTLVRTIHLQGLRFLPYPLLGEGDDEHSILIQEILGGRELSPTIAKQAYFPGADIGVLQENWWGCTRRVVACRALKSGIAHEKSGFQQGVSFSWFSKKNSGLPNMSVMESTGAGTRNVHFLLVSRKQQFRFCPLLALPSLFLDLIQLVVFSSESELNSFFWQFLSQWIQRWKHTSLRTWIQWFLPLPEQSFSLTEKMKEALKSWRWLSRSVSAPTRELGLCHWNEDRTTRKQNRSHIRGKHSRRRTHTEQICIGYTSATNSGRSGRIRSWLDLCTKFHHVLAHTPSCSIRKDSFTQK